MCDEVWKNALRRFTSRVERLKLKARKDITRKGDSSLVKWNQYNLEVEPFGSFNDRGWFAYHREMEAVLIKLELIKPQTYIPHHNRGLDSRIARIINSFQPSKPKDLKLQWLDTELD